MQKLNKRELIKNEVSHMRRKNLKFKAIKASPNSQSYIQKSGFYRSFDFMQGIIWLDFKQKAN